MALDIVLAIYILPAMELKKKKTLLIIGSSAIVLFVLIRLINEYGDASHWSRQPSLVYTFLSFIKVTKYPLYYMP
jgi:uncharacterized membrane protein